MCFPVPPANVENTLQAADVEGFKHPDVSNPQCNGVIIGYTLLTERGEEAETTVECKALARRQLDVELLLARQLHGIPQRRVSGPV